ncbi:hypothetical protein POTOM_031343 [Populus tomentosa]|uniref:AAA ATPase AAA+ lid domain-containing protein n=1 Tax=Populus tomentosa TaxID=118781 RepID=A0A8X8CIE3_POPTO|nr:hypothetical protein POTOM_031343 [Populus tomentosa]
MPLTLQLVFRAVGFHGADIRNLVNEAAIMSVRKGHSKIYQKVDVLDKQLLEGMGVHLTEEEQQKCEHSTCLSLSLFILLLPGGKVKFLFASWICDCCYSTAAVSSNHFSFPLIFIFLVKHEQETAISVFYSREDMVDQGYTAFGYLKMQMVVAHG